MSSTRDKIKQKTLELLSRHGYIGASMRSIAGEVGIRESAIYNHFVSKDELVNSVFEDVRSKLDLVRLIDDEILDHLDNPRKFLLLFTSKLLAHWANEKQRMIFRIILLEEFNTHENHVKIEDAISKLNEVWVIIFNEMMKYKLIKKQNVEIVANEFIAPLFFIRLRYLTSNANLDLPKAINEAETHVQYFWHSIKL